MQSPYQITPQIIELIAQTRKDYMAVFKDISTATASRDLQNGVSNGKLQKTGEKSTIVYVVVEKQ